MHLFAILSMYRMIFAAALILPFILPRKEEFLSIKRRDWFFLCMSGFFLGLHFVLWFGSLKLTTVASSTIIIALQPMVSLLGGFLIFRERTTMSALLTMCAAIVGALMIGWGDIGHSKEAILGDLLSFLSVIAVVCYLLIGQQAVRKISHWIYSFCVFGFAGLFLILFNLLQQTPFIGYPAKEWGIFLLLAIIPTMSHVINNWLLTYVNATTISMSILGEPVGATILAVWSLERKSRSNAWRSACSFRRLFLFDAAASRYRDENKKIRLTSGFFTLLNRFFQLLCLILPRFFSIPFVFF